MKEQPLIVTTELISKILDGAKTQTRRVIKPQPDKHTIIYIHDIGAREKRLALKCPYGQVGDRLWVREKALYWDGGAAGISSVVYTDDPEISQLLEDNNRLLMARTLSNIEAGENVVGKWVWKPSIHMYREDSRITLEITGIRVERLQEITVDGCVAEGYPLGEIIDSLNLKQLEIAIAMRIGWYRTLWDSLNAKRGYSWESNPWVWVIEFKKVDYSE